MITPLPTPPSRGSSPTTFSDDADEFVGAMPDFVTEANALAAQVNADAIAAANDAEAAGVSAGEAAASEAAAEEHKIAAAASEVAAGDSAADADADAIVVANHRVAAGVSETNAANSEAAAEGFRDEAETFRDQAVVSAAATAADVITTNANAAAAAISEDNAAASEAAVAANTALAIAAAQAAVNAPGTNATSTSSVTIGTGTKSFAIQTGKEFAIGQFLVAAKTSAPSNFMVGQCTAADKVAGTISINVADIDDTGGSGTHTDWTLALTAFASLAATTPDDGSITLAQLADLAQATIIGRPAGAGTGVPQALSAYQIKAILALVAADISGLGTLATQNGTFSGTSSGTNTGDQTSVSGNAGTATALATARNIDGQSFNGTGNITVIAPGTHAASSKSTPADTDELPLVDTEAANVLKKVTWANIKATLKAYFDNIYQPVNTLLSAIAGLSANGLIACTASGASAARTIVSTGSGLVITNGDGVGGNPTITVSALGHQWIPSAAFRPSKTGGCAAFDTVAVGSNQPDIAFLGFDGTTQEYCQFAVAFPKGWDEGTVTVRFHWSHPSTVTNFGVRWGMQGVAISDGETRATAFGTAQEVSDTGGSTDYLYVSPTTSAITIAGSPAVGDQVHFRIYRDPANGADTMSAVDARLEGITLFYTINTLDNT